MQLEARTQIPSKWLRSWGMSLWKKRKKSRLSVILINELRFFISTLEDRRREIKIEELPLPQTPTSQQKQKSRDSIGNKSQEIRKTSSFEENNTQNDRLVRKESQSENKENVPERKVSQPSQKSNVEPQKPKEKEKEKEKEKSMQAILPHVLNLLFIEPKRKNTDEAKTNEQENNSKRPKTQQGNKKPLDSDPQLNDPYYKEDVNKRSQQTHHDDGDEECVFGEKIHQKLREVAITDSSDDDGKKRKKKTKRSDTKDTLTSKSSISSFCHTKRRINYKILGFESGMGNESFLDKMDEENPTPKMVKKTRKVSKLVEFRDERGYLRIIIFNISIINFLFKEKKETTEIEEYWEEEKPKQALNSSMMNANAKTKAAPARDKNQSALT